MNELTVSAIELIVVTALLYSFKKEKRIAAWEQRQWERFMAWEQKQWQRFKRFIRRQLRKNSRIVAWAEKPTKHGKPDYQFRLDQAEVWSRWHTA